MTFTMMLSSPTIEPWLDPEIVSVERGGRIRLRIINAASASRFWIDLGA